MRRFFSTFVLMLLFTSAFSQKTILYKEYYDYYKTHLKRVWHELANGKKHGEEKTFYENGIIQSVSMYRYGFLINEKIFYKDNSLCEETNLNGNPYDNEYQGWQSFYNYNNGKNYLDYKFRVSNGIIKEYYYYFSANRLEEKFIDSNVITYICNDKESGKPIISYVINNNKLSGYINYPNSNIELRVVNNKIDHYDSPRLHIEKIDSCNIIVSSPNRKEYRHYDNISPIFVKNKFTTDCLGRRIVVNLCSKDGGVISDKNGYSVESSRYSGSEPLLQYLLEQYRIDSVMHVDGEGYKTIEKHSISDGFTSTTYDKEGKITKKQKKYAKTDVYMEYYSNGNLKNKKTENKISENEFENIKLEYYANGNLKDSSYNGIDNRTSVQFYENGKMENKYVWNKGRSYYEKYSDQGKLINGTSLEQKRDSLYEKLYELTEYYHEAVLGYKYLSVMQSRFNNFNEDEWNRRRGAFNEQVYIEDNIVMFEKYKYLKSVLDSLMLSATNYKKILDVKDKEFDKIFEDTGIVDGSKHVEFLSQYINTGQEIVKKMKKINDCVSFVYSNQKNTILMKDINKKIKEIYKNNNEQISADYFIDIILNFKNNNEVEFNFYIMKFPK